MEEKVFISYKSEHRAIAVRIRDTLKSWGYQTWFDQDDIRKGQYFRDEIQVGLESSVIIVGIMTRKALQSREVLAEWDYAFSRRLRLLLLRYENVDLPYWLAGVQYIDCTQDEKAGLEQLRQSISVNDTSIYRHSSADFSTKPTENEQALTVQSDDIEAPDNRVRMLNNVYQMWIVGALQTNLHNGSIELELGLKADAVLRHVDYGDYKLPDSSRDIAKIYDDMNGELLILGEPGSGKTVLLLQLAQALLERAQINDKLPIPVVFNLSSWAKEQKPLKNWLVDELKRSYQVPKKQAQEWIEQNQLTLLLDGMDEVALSHQYGDEKAGIQIDEQAFRLRSDCIATINAYRSNYPGMNIVVCSRIQDYEVVQRKLDLNSAILLQPLSDAQVAEYFSAEKYAGIRELIKNETTAQEMSTIPFIASIMKLTYAGKPYAHTPHNELRLANPTEKARLNHLLSQYAEQQLQEIVQFKVSITKARHYLEWLGYQMLRYRTSIFYVEDLQPFSLENKGTYDVQLHFIGSLGIGLIVGLIVSSGTGRFISIAVTLPIMLAAFIRLSGDYEIKFLESIKWSPTLADLARWGRKGLWLALTPFFYFCFYGQFFSWNITLTDTLFAIFSGMAAVWILVVLFEGLREGMKVDKQIQYRLTPNSAFTTSIRNGLKLLMITTIVGVIILGLISATLALMLHLVFFDIFRAILAIGFGIGLGLGLIFGGEAILKHLILRWRLSREGHIPFGRYDTFLDCAAKIGLMRKAGGGYIFRHRMLLEYFAAEYRNKHK